MSLGKSTLGSSALGSEYNTNPVAANDSYTLTAGSVYNVSQANGVLGNDTYNCNFEFSAAFSTDFNRVQ